MVIPMSNEDPYDTPEERAEIGTPFFLRWSGKDGLYSTWRERHIALRGFVAGWKVGGKNPLAAIMGDLPDCPDEWNDEGQYWDTHTWFGNLAKIASWIMMLNTAGGLAVLKLVGVI